MFKTIKGFESYGEINELGEIKAFHAKKLRKTFKDVTNQICVTIKGKRCRVKDLVAVTFIREYESEFEKVIYLNGDKNNVHYSNLDIVPRYKLNKEQVAAIKEQYAKGHKISSIAKQFGVSKTSVSRILKGETWKF